MFLTGFWTTTTSSIYGMDWGLLWLGLACCFIALLVVLASVHCCLKSRERIRGAEPVPLIVGQSRSQVE